MHAFIYTCMCVCEYKISIFRTYSELKKKTRMFITITRCKLNLATRLVKFKKKKQVAKNLTHLHI